MVNALKYISSAGIGKSGPQLFECDDGKRYVVKFMSNPFQGDTRKSLVNELISNKLAKYLNLPVPEGQVIYFSIDLIKQIPELEAYHIQPGPHFGNISYENIALPIEHERIKKCVNLSDMPGIIVFDHWVQNQDRANNLFNLIIVEGEEYNKLYMIDHDRCFYSRERDVLTLRNKAQFIEILWGDIYRQFKPFIREKDAFLKYVTAIEDFPNHEIKNIVYSMPEEWVSDKGELNAIDEFLIERKLILKESIYLLYNKHWS
ncbi:HipA family kinase [Bacillus paramycoides]|uniref:HipA family kinase n=1 Tax=Bacillus paramycoides TaxID=2026194 RepID=UPI002E1AC6FE|nr:hypothetical protein [Bacillus paramycoides]